MSDDCSTATNGHEIGGGREPVASWEQMQTFDALGGTLLLSRFKGQRARRFGVVVILGLGVIPALIFLLVNWRAGSLYLPGEALGYLEDVIFAFFFLAIPAMVILMRQALEALPDTLMSLVSVVRKSDTATAARDGGGSDERLDSEVHDREKASGSEVMTPERFEDMLRRHGDLLAGRRGPARVVRYACYLIGLTYVAVAFHAHYQAEATYGFDIWSSQHHLLNLWLRTIYELLVFGLVVPMLAFKFIMVQHVIRSVFCDLTRKRVIRLRPLSPDNAGGLGQVGDYALRIVYVLLPPLIPMLLYMFVLRVTPIILIGLGIYIPLLILVFFYPLSGAHRAMKCFKQQELDLLAGEFERVYDCFIGRITQGHDRDPEATARAMEMIGNIDALYDRADAMPVWPFNRQIISRFSAVVAGPVAVLVNEFVINPDSMLWDQAWIQGLFG